MSFETRKELIKQIEQLRGSRVITHINGDRRCFPPGFDLPGIRTQLATEAQVWFYKTLKDIGQTDNIDLFLYTRGGSVDSIWPLVNLFREFTQKKFSVLVPFRAHSAGTMICLGSDQIVMGEAAELSPIDPSTGNQFNPIDEINKNNRKPISVEDVTSYIELAKDPSKVGIQDSDHILEVFKRLSEEVNPLALGNVNRVHIQIRDLARKLLKYKDNSDKEKQRVETIVDTLTRDLFSHNHAINRNEASKLFGNGFIENSSNELQDIMWDLYQDYSDTMNLEKTLCRDEYIEIINREKEFIIYSGFIESTEGSYVYKSKIEIQQGSVLPNGTNLQVSDPQQLQNMINMLSKTESKIMEFGWTENSEGI